MKNRPFPIEFKQESASLVVDKGYCTQEACEAVGVSERAMRRWVKQLKEERNGTTPIGSKALTAEHQRIQELQEGRGQAPKNCNCNMQANTIAL